MSDTMTDAALDPTAPPRPTELEMLKQRAAAMGISHSNNIGVDALRAKIDAKLKGEPEAPEQPAAPQVNPFEMAQARQAERVDIQKQLESEEEPVRQMSLREYMLKEQMKLVRCRITNLDPKKKDLPGEIITVANEYLGTVRKLIPYGEATDEGYHIPFCIYTFLKERRFLSITTKKDKRTGTNQVSSRYVPELSIEVLEPLTREELSQLARAQIAAGSIVETE